MKAEVGASRPVQAMELMRIVADSYGIAQGDLRRPGGGRVICQAKKVVIEKLRAQGYSLQKIGYLMGGMHHTTVRGHLIRPASDQRVLRPTNAQRLVELEETVKTLLARIEALETNRTQGSEIAA